MTARVLIRPREYHDSVRLMRVSEAIRHEAGVEEAMVMMATPNNKKILATSGLLTEAAEAARPDDLVIALTALSEDAADAGIAAAEAALAQRAAAGQGGILPRTLDAAHAMRPDATLAMISVPGAHAFREAKRALELGLNVFLFSDNVPLEDERRLKELAAERARLVMGPDCGTAIIGGTGLGFANKVARGIVGIVGASGTGTQEISSLLDWLGVGVSHAIGTGGRDLKAEIGGLTMLAALDMLAHDDATQVIVVTSKPPNPAIAAKVMARCAEIPKPVVVNFLGNSGELDESTLPDGIHLAGTLAGAAVKAASLAGGATALPCTSPEDVAALMAMQNTRQPQQRYLRGLYAGGTLCYEALSLLGQTFAVNSNLAHGPQALTDLDRSRGHTVLDMGEDAFTDGRAHPMIDPRLRNERILQEAADPEVALLLIDMVLGYGAHTDPAAGLAGTVTRAREVAAGKGRTLPVIVSVCGTRDDPQDHAAQVATLRAAGITVAFSNAEAVSLAARYLGEIR